jgi:hypothetical protein
MMLRGSQRPPDPAGDPARWVGWRTQRLLTAGFPPPVAQRLAADTQVDVHALLELSDRGCPPDLAVRITAPLDTEPGIR